MIVLRPAGMAESSQAARWDVVAGSHALGEGSFLGRA